MKTTDLNNWKSAGKVDINDNMETIGQLLTGAAIANALYDLAMLRLDIFAEYPCLYQGKKGDELTYLTTYAKTPYACAILAL